jgi:hypothetical protein
MIRFSYIGSLMMVLLYRFNNYVVLRTRAESNEFPPLTGPTRKEGRNAWGYCACRLFENGTTDRRYIQADRKWPLPF